MSYVSEVQAGTLVVVIEEPFFTQAEPHTLRAVPRSRSGFLNLLTSREHGIV